MEAINWRRNQQGGEACVDTSDSRAQLQCRSRKIVLDKMSILLELDTCIVENILDIYPHIRGMGTLLKHLLCCGPDGINEPRRTAGGFEEKICAATLTRYLFFPSMYQTDYLGKIYQKKTAMENKYHNVSCDLQSGSSVNTDNPPNPANQVPSSQPMSDLPKQQQQKMIGRQPVRRRSNTRKRVKPAVKAKPVRQKRRHLDEPRQNMTMHRLQLQQQQSGVQIQRHQGAGVLPQTQNVADQQKQLHQPEIAPPENSSISQDSTSQTGNASDVHWREELYQKIYNLKEMYLPRLTEIRRRLLDCLQGRGSLQQRQLSEDRIEVIRRVVLALDEHMAFISVPKCCLTQIHREEYCIHEMRVLRIIEFLNIWNLKLQLQLPCSAEHTTQSHVFQVSLIQPFDSDQVNSGEGSRASAAEDLAATSKFHMQQERNFTACKATGSASDNYKRLRSPNSTASSLASEDSIGQTRNVNKGDWREELYQKIHRLKEMYLPALTEKRQDLLENLQRVDSLPRNKIPDNKLEMARRFMLLLEQNMAFINVSKCCLTQMHREKYSSYETSILKMIEGCKNWKMKQLWQFPSSVEQMTQSQAVPESTSQALLPNISMIQSLLLMRQEQKKRLRLQQRQIQQQVMLRHQLNKQREAEKRHVQMPPPNLMNDTNNPRMRHGIDIQPNLLQPHHSFNQHAFSSPQQPNLVGAQIGSPQSLQQPSPQLDWLNSLATEFEATLPTEPSEEQSFDHLVREFLSEYLLASSEPSTEAVGEITDRIAGSAPEEGYRAAVGEGWAATTNLYLQPAHNFTTREETSIAGYSYKQSRSLDITASFHLQRLKIQRVNALMKEIEEINQGLLDVVVDIWGEDVRGTIVRCSYAAVSLSPPFKALYTSGQISQIQPLYLLVLESYPYCSPIFMDKFPMEASEDLEDLSLKTKSKFSRSAKTLPKPMSLKDIARTWEASARFTMLVFTHKHG